MLERSDGDEMRVGIDDDIWEGESETEGAGKMYHGSVDIDMMSRANEQAWMDFTPGNGGDGGYFEDGNTQHKNDWALNHQNGWITQDWISMDDFDDTDSVSNSWTQNEGIYSNVRRDEDLTDATGADGAWCVQAGENGGMIGDEDSRGYARCYRWFDLDDYIFWDTYTVTGARVWLDYKIWSDDFDNAKDFVILTAYISDGGNTDMLEHFKVSNDALADNGGKCIDFWDVDDPNSGVTNPSTNVNNKVLDTLSGGGNLPNWFNNHALNNREYVVIFQVEMRLYGTPWYDMEYFKFWLDDVQVSLDYTAVDLSADLTADVVEGYAPLDVSFSSGARGGQSPLSYSWNFKDGGTSQSASPNHRFNNPGTYQVELKVTDHRSRTTTDTKTITVHQVPTASIDAMTPNPATEGEQVSMRGSMAGGWGPMSMADWQFGDGATATGEQVNHAYSRSGAFNVKFRAKDSHDTYTNWVTATVNINRKPEGSIDSVSPNPATEGVGIDFAGSGSHGTGSLSYQWDFGDGHTSSSRTATHSYSSHGTYSVSFKVKDGHGIWSSPKTVTVTVNREPVASISSVMPDPATATESVSFSGDGNFGTGAYTYSWDFGDGATSTDRNPGHAYANAGTYTVSLKIKDSQNVWSRAATTDVTINERPGAVISGASPDPATLTESISFSCTTSGGTGGIGEYLWNMGDGDTYSRRDPGHIYDAPGTYTVKLKVKDGHGVWSEEASREVTVNPRPAAEIISMVPNPATAGAEVSFDGSGTGGTGGIIGFKWEFGDGEEAEDAATTHIYGKDGALSVSFLVKDGHGIWSEPATTELVINPLPLAVIESVSANPATASESILFSGTGTRGTGGIVEFLWDFGDGSTDPGSSPEHAFREDGEFGVTFKVKDSLGIWSEPAAVTVVVNPLPEADIVSISHESATRGTEITFSGAGSGGTGGITGYDWQSSIDGKLSEKNEFSTSALSVGIHTIYLRCGDSHGIWGENAEKRLVIDADPGAPTASIESISPNVLSYGETVTFKGSSRGGSNSYDDYMWRSDLDGILSRRATFSLNNLSVGDHAIYFKVMDSKERWSSEVVDYVTVEVDESAPVAEIESITPNPAYSGDEVTFRGSGREGTGVFIEYKWRSSIDGELSRSDRFSTTTLSAGTHTISFSVRDDSSLWSGAVTEELMVTDTSSAPSAVIEKLEPGSAVQGQSITFVGRGEAKSGTIVEYIWTSDIDGELFRGQSSTIMDISVGNHIITLVVKDSNARSSPPARKVLIVEGREGAPVAVIEGIAPNPASEGENITFSGNATGGSNVFEEYIWRSSIEGIISKKPVFSKTLDAGTHRIYLKVRDSGGLWSSEVEMELGVSSARVNLGSILTMSPDDPVSGQEVTFRSVDHGGDVVEFLFIFRSGASSGWTDSSQIKHVYPEPGRYVAGLRLRDSEGNEGDFTWMEVSVGEKKAESVGSMSDLEVTWYYYVIIGAVVLLFLFILILMIVRRRRTEEEEIIDELEPEVVSLAPILPPLPSQLSSPSLSPHVGVGAPAGSDGAAKIVDYMTPKLPELEGTEKMIFPKYPEGSTDLPLYGKKPPKLLLPVPEGSRDTAVENVYLEIDGKWPEEMKAPTKKGAKAPKIVSSSGPEKRKKGAKAPKIVGEVKETGNEVETETKTETGAEAKAEADRFSEVQEKEAKVKVKARTETPLISIKPGVVPGPIANEERDAGAVPVIKVRKDGVGKPMAGAAPSKVIRPKMPREMKAGRGEGRIGLSSKTRGKLDALIRKYENAGPEDEIVPKSPEVEDAGSPYDHDDEPSGPASSAAKEWLNDLVKKHGN